MSYDSQNTRSQTVQVKTANKNFLKMCLSLLFLFLVLSSAANTTSSKSQSKYNRNPSNPGDFTVLDKILEKIRNGELRKRVDSNPTTPSSLTSSSSSSSSTSTQQTDLHYVV